MRRWLLIILALVSGVLFLAFSAAWVKSYQTTTAHGYSAQNIGWRIEKDGWTLTSMRGEVGAEEDFRKWYGPRDEHQWICVNWIVEPG